LPDLLVDERRVRQVLINLLNNAVKFTPDHGSVALEVCLGTSRRVPKLNSSLGETEVHQFLEISVVDTGIGIAPEDVRKLFQPFMQVDSALNRQYTGTGLGLALVKRIVELHGGEVSLVSELGVGSRFTVDLPCANTLSGPDQPATGAIEATEPSPAVPLESPLILLAEDNEANVSTIVAYLQAKGYRLTLAKNGEEAVAFAKAAPPDLILMDIQMPVMDGLEATRQIRQDPTLANVPIIALTALAMAGDRERCLAAGASDYLSKPVRLKQLAAMIQEFLAAIS
jgi:CheY-like chemotaxis protein